NEMGTGLGGGFDKDISSNWLSSLARSLQAFFHRLGYGSNKELKWIDEIFSRPKDVKTGMLAYTRFMYKKSHNYALVIDADSFDIVQSNKYGRKKRIELLDNLVAYLNKNYRKAGGKNDYFNRNNINKLFTETSDQNVVNTREKLEKRVRKGNTMALLALLKEMNILLF
ncbi:MAG: hypothetical protein ACFFD4_13970, partial [Candidatus Odinarchaeota archaeon]